MGDYSIQRVPALLAIVFVLIVQCQSITTYKCTNQTNACGCSRRPHASLKVLGGQSALLSNWDWVVSIRELGEHTCTGSVLNEWYIITVAHCFENVTDITSEMTICAGTFRLSDPCHQRRTIDSVVIHPSYNRTTIENDIALIRLTTPLDFSDSSVTPVCLPSTDDPDDYPAIGTEVVSIGWGILKSNDTPDILQEVTLKVMNSLSIQCYHIKNDRLQLCAGGLEKGLSKGDSGGPLMHLKASKQWELVGLAAFTKPHPILQFGGGYIRIAPLLKFIETNIQKPSVNSTPANCSCQCPRGFNSGYTQSTINSLGGCVNACMAEFSSSCTSSNTYACHETECTYSKSYNVSTIVPIHDNQSSSVYTVVIFTDGHKYEGQTKNGKKHGRGTYTWPSGEKYTGDWVNNRKTGTGVFTWPDGTKYEGQLINDKKHGKGTYKSSDGRIYMGDWIDDSKTGKGTQTFPNGYKYVGDWIDDNKTGKGVAKFSNGDRYAGDWIDSTRTGKGIYTWEDGDKYIGDWIDDSRTGNGIMIGFNGNTYKGQFKDGMKHGQGTFTTITGSKYVGNWVEDTMTGEGVYTWLAGHRFEGHFKNGDISGNGTMHYSNGTIQSGSWPDGPFTYS